VPQEAIELIEDIQTLEHILDLLEKLRGTSLTVATPNHQQAALEARQMLRRVGFLISGMQRIAEDNLRFHHLAGQRVRRARSRQTLADVWQTLMDGKENLNESNAKRSNPI
jgi:hypothetical protein